MRRARGETVPSLIGRFNALLSRAGHGQNRVAPAAFHGVGSSKKLGEVRNYRRPSWDYTALLWRRFHFMPSRRLVIRAFLRQLCQEFVEYFQCLFLEHHVKQQDFFPKFLSLKILLR